MIEQLEKFAIQNVATIVGGDGGTGEWNQEIGNGGWEED